MCVCGRGIATVNSTSGAFGAEARERSSACARAATGERSKKTKSAYVRAGE
jgi:hypothetical protein